MLSKVKRLASKLAAFVLWAKAKALAYSKAAQRLTRYHNAREPRL